MVQGLGGYTKRSLTWADVAARISGCGSPWLTRPYRVMWPSNSAQQVVSKHSCSHSLNNQQDDNKLLDPHWVCPTYLVWR